MISGFNEIRLLWSGEWPLAQALGLGLLLTALIWVIYRKELSKGTSGQLRWLLPTLRCLAIIGITLTLAGPILQLQREEGNRGRITVFLDSSESMNLKDKSFGPGRKILLAQEHGFLPKESNVVDFSLYDASRKMKHAARALRKCESIDSVKENKPKVKDSINQCLDILKDLDALNSIKDKEGFLLEELWLNLDGDQIEYLLDHKNYKTGKPDSSSYLNKSESPRNAGDRFGRRIRANIKAPMDGEYKFWLFSDDASVLRIAQPGSKKFRTIAEVKSHNPYSWSQALSSQNIFLKAGESYPIELIHKEGSGEDFSAFGWTLPDGKEEKPIPGNRFTAPLAENDASQNISLSEKIRQTFSSVLASAAAEGNDDSIDYDALAQQAIEIGYLLEEQFDIYADSMLDQNINSLNEAINDFEKFTRMERASLLLNHPTHGFLDEFKDTHILEIRNLSENSTDVIWNNLSEIKNFDCKINPESPYTDLSKGIQDALKVEVDFEKGIQQTASRSAAVLITDGGHNKGGSPLLTAKLLAARNLPIYTVGLGSDKRPPDLALLQTFVPDSVYKEDRIQGILSYKDHLLPGSPFSILITDEQGEIVWEKSMVGIEAGITQLSFDFSASEIVKRAMAGLAESKKEALRTVPLSFKVTVEPIEGENETDNNQIFFSIDANMRKNQLLILDSRPRWETRYLNNLFERDERWEVSCVWGEPKNSDKKLPRGENRHEFPLQGIKLLEFDLIIFGEIPPGELSHEEQTWVVDFVGKKGGGILFIDGPRQKLRTYENPDVHPIFSLFPVSWIENGPVRLNPKSFFRPKESNRLSALTLDPIDERNEEVWKHLPLPAWSAPVNCLPGSEVFLEASVHDGDDNSADDRIPILAGKRVGAGKSFYMGFDESWRWRYEVADLYHQRFWNQLLTRVMERPFALNREELSMDVGGTSHAPGKAIPIRTRVRDNGGNSLKPPYPEVDALIWKEGEVVASIPLQGKESSNGLFTGEISGLESGSYEMSIRAPALLDEMEFSQHRLSFQIETLQNQERNFLTCNENLLREMAENSGGNFLREENFHELKDALRPISSGRIIITEITLWQSFGWLGFVVFLLALEMFLRKRAGMM